MKIPLTPDDIVFTDVKPWPRYVFTCKGRQAKRSDLVFCPKINTLYQANIRLSQGEVSLNPPLMVRTALATLLLSLLFLTPGIAQPPYGGTIFIDPDIIRSTDSSTLVSVTYQGRGMRTVFDRRINNWTTIDAYLFTVVWNDGLTSEAQINPEFGSVAAATVEAEKYGRAIGQLPNCLRTDVDAIWIHRGTQPFGGGNRSILVHTGQSALYEADGILEETLVHEASHTSLDATHAAAAGWINAQQRDGNFISTYARDNPTREDIAESFLTWLAIRHRQDQISPQDFTKIAQAIPNRIAYFDNQAFNLYPITGKATSVRRPPAAVVQVQAFPNPFSSETRLTFFLQKETNLSITMYDLAGRKVRTLFTDKPCPPGENNYTWDGRNDDGKRLPNNLYLVEIKAANQLPATLKVLLISN